MAVRSLALLIICYSVLSCHFKKLWLTQSVSNICTPRVKKHWIERNILLQLHIFKCKKEEELKSTVKKHVFYVSIWRCFYLLYRKCNKIRDIPTIFLSAVPWGEGRGPCLPALQHRSLQRLHNVSAPYKIPYMFCLYSYYSGQTTTTAKTKLLLSAFSGSFGPMCDRLQTVKFRLKSEMQDQADLPLVDVEDKITICLAAVSRGNFLDLHGDCPAAVYCYGHALPPQRDRGARRRRRR